MYNKVTSKEDGGGSKCLLLTIDIFYIRHCSPCVGQKSPDWIITISVLAQKQRLHGRASQARNMEIALASKEVTI